MSTQTGRDVPLPQLIELLQLCVTAAETVIPHLRFDPHERNDAFIVALLCQIADYARGVISAGLAGTYALIPGGARSAFYAYVDLVNLCDHTDYWKTLELADAHSWKPILEEATRGKNPFLKGITDSDLLKPGRSHYARLRKSLEKEGAERMEIGDRFEKAGLLNESNSAYGMLSADVHNNVSSLVLRYFVVSEERVRLRGPGDEKPSVYELPCTLLMSEMLLRAMEKALHHFGHGIAALFRANERFTMIAVIVSGTDGNLQVAEDRLEELLVEGLQGAETELTREDWAAIRRGAAEASKDE